jgi:hypothetical protein
VFRLNGGDRIATATTISGNSYPYDPATGDPRFTLTIVLARADDYADALAGAPLAALKQAPILLTSPTRLDPRTLAEMNRIMPFGTTDATVYLLGGTTALNPGIETELRSHGYTTVRLAGADRYGTAVQVAGALGDPSTLLEVDGTSFADALAAGPAAARAHGAILLTNGRTPAPATAAYLLTHPGGTRYALGGPAAAADPAATPIVGADRYDTAALVAQRFFAEPAAVGLVSGERFPDGLAGGAHIAASDAPLLLVKPTALPNSTESWLRDNAQTITSGYLYGGPATTTDAVLIAASAAIT